MKKIFCVLLVCFLSIFIPKNVFAFANHYSTHASTFVKNAYLLQILYSDGSETVARDMALYLKHAGWKKTNDLKSYSKMLKVHIVIEQVHNLTIYDINYRKAKQKFAYGDIIKTNSAAMGALEKIFQKAQEVTGYKL